MCLLRVRDLGEQGLQHLPARPRVRKAPRELVDRLHHLDRRGPSTLSFEGERAIDDAGDALIQIWTHHRERPRRLRGRLNDDLLRVLPLVHQPAGEKREHRGAHRPEVRPSVDLLRLCERLLGRHVRRRPHHHAGGGRVVVGARSLAHARDSEVEHLERPVPKDEQVGRLDVAMHDALRVRGCEDVEQLLGDGEDGRERQLSSELLLQCVDANAVEQLHDEEGRAVLRHVIVEHRDRAGMVDLVADVPFTQEALAKVFLEGQLRVKHLHREAFQVAMRRGVDHRHSAVPEQAIEAVLPAQDAPDALRAARIPFAFGHVERFYTTSPALSFWRVSGERSTAQWRRPRGGLAPRTTCGWPWTCTNTRGRATHP